MPPSPVTYITGFIADPRHWYETLWSELAWEKRPDAPRHEYWTNAYGRPYTYGRGAGERTYASGPDHPLIAEARTRLKAETLMGFEGCFLNRYGTARDWLGWHADDDPGIDHTKPIAVITVGQGRRIEWREILMPGIAGAKAVYGPVDGIDLEAGSLFLMHAGMQETHEHRIPKVGHEVEPRVSMTFRGLIA